MTQEIECPGKHLEKFILRAEQISHYNDISGEPDRRLVRNKRDYEELADYYHKAKQFAKLFAEEDYEKAHRMILGRLKYHIIACHNCAKEKKELEIKYKNLKAEELEKLTKEEKTNLRSFGLLE